MEGLKRIKGENHIITCKHKGGGRAWRWGGRGGVGGILVARSHVLPWLVLCC